MGCDCGCGCAKAAATTVPARAAPWIAGSVKTPAGDVPLTTASLGVRDRFGGLRVRLGIRRDSYTVSPGLYAVSSPDSSSPVLVTANYKLSFDALRRELRGLDAWILVLDTRGINVWCAAGKGTFGTKELVARIEAVGLARIVAHRRLILPQLGATGVSAHEVKRTSGFSVTYGPVRAADLPGYLASGLSATPDMRRVSFGLRDRLAVTPVEVNHVLPYAAGMLALALVLVLIRTGTPSIGRTLRAALPVWGAMAIGTIMVPMLLPLLPVRAFSIKGALLGLAWAVGVCFWYLPSLPGMLGLLLLLPAVAGFLAMNFTGSTTFTSLSGVNAEVRTATPVIAVAAALGIVLYTVAVLTGGMV